MPKFPNIQVRGSTLVKPNKTFYNLKKYRSNKGILGMSFFLGALLICFILAAISVDFARQVAVQTELQSATDAAAIAAEYAITHPSQQSTAQSTAPTTATTVAQYICSHDIANGALIPSGNVTTVVNYPSSSVGSSNIPTVTVTAYVNCINLFASQFGRPSDKISATSVAGEVNPGAANSIFPLAIPPNTWAPGKIYTVYMLTNPGSHNGAPNSLSPGSTPYTNGPNSTTPLPGLPVTPTTNDHNPFNTFRFITPPGDNSSPLPAMIPYLTTNSSPGTTPNYSINPTSPQALPNITNGTQYSVPSAASLPNISVGQQVNLTTNANSDGSIGLNTAAQFMQGAPGNGYTFSTGSSPSTGTATLTTSPTLNSSNQIIGNSSTSNPSVNYGSVAPFLNGTVVPVAIVSPGGSDGGGGKAGANSTNLSSFPNNGYGNDNNSHGTVQGFAQIQIQGVTVSWYGWGASVHADNAFANQLVGITFKMISANGSTPIGGTPNPNMYTPVLIQ